MNFLIHATSLFLKNSNNLIEEIFMNSHYLKLILDFVLDAYTNTEGYVLGVSFGNTLLIVILLLLIWFLSGLLFALWVRKDIKVRGTEEYFYIIIILFTSFIGFIIYEIFKAREECELDPEGSPCDSTKEAEKIINEELNEEFEDDVEELTEEDVEDIIDEKLKES